MAQLDGAFYIKSLENNLTFTARLADQAAIVTDGYGGWQTVPRPKDVAVVEWQGRNTLAIEIPFMIDFWASSDEAEATTTPGKDCEEQAGNLEHLAGLGCTYQPPICLVDGYGAIPHDFTQRPKLRWVVEGLQWDKAIELRRRDNGRRLRCGGTITMRQFLTARDVLHKIDPKDKAVMPKRHQVQRGDTLQKLAKVFYHDPNLWKIIADANNMRDR